MKIIEGNYWLKPFGSQINCINSIYGECPKNINNIDECIKICEESPLCNAGYFVEDENTNSKYCVPLFTSTWKNSNVYDYLIDSRNDTPISSNKGVKSTVFVNEKVFIDQEKLSNDFFNNLFIGDKVYFRIHDGKNLFYLQENFNITFDVKKAVKITLGQNDILNWISYRIRITNKTNITFDKDNTLLTMNIDDRMITHLEKNPIKFIWYPYVESNLGFCIESNKFFINNKETFNLYKIIDNEKKYLIIDNNILCLPNKKNEKQDISFSFEKIVNDEQNIYSQLSYKNPNKSKGKLWNSMNIFLKNNLIYPQFNHTDERHKKKNFYWWIINFILIFLIIFFLIILYIKLK